MSIGEAVVEIGADPSNFRKDLNQGTEPAFNDLEQDADRSGKRAGKSMGLGMLSTFDKAIGGNELSRLGDDSGRRFTEAFQKAGSALSEFQVSAELDDASFLKAAQQANFQMRQSLERARIEGDLDTGSFESAVRLANLELREIENSIKVGVEVDRARFTDVVREAGGILNNGFTRMSDGLGDGAGRGFNRSFLGSLTGGAGDIATKFSEAIQGGIVSSPYIGIGVVGAILAVMPLAGTLAAGAFVLAFGAGLAGLGIVFAAQNPKIRALFKDLGKDIAAEMRTISKPFEGTLRQVAETARKTFDSLSPDLAGSFATIAPALSGFVEDLGAAFEKLGPALGPVSEAFADILAAVGDRLPGLFEDIADSMINLSESIDPEQFAGLLTGILGLIPAITNMIAGLTRAQQVMQPWFTAIVDAVGMVLPALKDLFAELGGGASAGFIFQTLGFIVKATATVITIAIRLVIKQLQMLKAVAGAIVSFVSGGWRNLGGVTKSVWNGIKASISGAIAAVRNTTRAGITAVRSFFTSGFNAVRNTVRAVGRGIQSVWTGALSAVRSVTSRGLSAVRSAFSSGLGAARSIVSGAMGRISSAVSSGISRVVGVVRGLPGRVRGALGSLGSTLYSSGLSLISGFARGITAGIGNAVSAASSAVGAVRNLFPFSPAKEGPFSGRGYTTFSGAALMRDFAESVKDTAIKVQPDISSALNPLQAQLSAPAAPGSTRPTPTPTSAPAAAAPTAGVDLAMLSRLFSSLQLRVQLGTDRRTMAEWYLNGKKFAEALA